MRIVWAVVALAGCQSGYELDVIVHPTCVSAPASLTVDVSIAPGGETGHTAIADPAAFFAAGARVAIIPPDGATSAAVTVVALDGSGAALGSGGVMAAISGHARAQVDLMLAGPSCATPCLVKADCAAQGPGFDCCGGGCVDVTSTAAHCGGCGMACSNENATPTCVANRCVATCAAGFADCNGDARTDGCEIDLTRDKSHCGACATGCPSIAGTDIECMSSICTVVTCPGTSVDCNHMPEDGCEADLMKDDAACGDCATSCVKPSHCTSGICNRFAFASSVLYHGDFGSVAVADGNCQALATAAGLPGTYKAWLADSDLNTAPGTRFNTASPVPIIDVQGSPIAQSYSDLVTNQQPAVPLDYSEKGTPAPSGTAGAKCAFAPLTPAWTNVGSDGRILMTGTSCTNWSTQTGTGNVGDARARSAMWTDANCPANCSDTAVLYCFQQ